MLNEISDCILLETPDRKVVFVNQLFCDLFKVPVLPRQLVGADCAKAAEMSAALFKHPQGFLDRIEAILARGEKVQGELVELADGSFFTRDYNPMIEGGKKGGHLWIYKDRTNEVNLLKKNLSQEEFYKNILNEIPADIALFDREHKYLFINKIAIVNEELREWIIGKDDFQYAAYRNQPPDRAQRRRQLFQKALRRGEVVEFEDATRTPNGKMTYNLRRFHPLKAEDGTVNFVVGYGINIDNLKAQQLELEKSESNYKALLNNIHEVSLTVDEDLVISFVNPVWTEITGYTLPESIGKTLATFFGQEVCEKTIGVLQRGYSSDNGGKVARSNWVFKNKWGIEKQLSLSMMGAERSGEHFVMIFILDVTDQWNATEELKKIAQKEKEISELKSAFLNMVSHELRTPLAIIQSTVDVMSMESETKALSMPTVFADMNIIKREIDRMTEIMNALLQLGENDYVKLRNRPVSVDPDPFFRKVLANKFIPWKDGRHLTILLKGKSGEIMVEVFILVQVLEILIENAFKYSKATQQVFFTVRKCRDHWSFLVVDAGIGIAVRDKGQLFSSFKRGSNVGNIPGTGMGLVLVLYYLQNMKASLHIKSTLGRGTAVYVKVPNNQG